MTIPTLYIVATPIGNLEDMTMRALRILTEVDVIAAEDTRHTGMLLTHFGIPKKRLISLYDEVEQQKIPEVIALLDEGKSVALVSDAGTPLICDPGFKLVREVRRLKYRIVSVPGPSSITAALSVAGVPTDKFLFVGYLPEKEVRREKQLNIYIRTLKETDCKTLIFFESPHRLKRCLQSIDRIVAHATVSVCRELTKQFEEVKTGTASELMTYFHAPKGEFVILLQVQ